MQHNEDPIHFMMGFENEALVQALIFCSRCAAEANDSRESLEITPKINRQCLFLFRDCDMRTVIGDLTCTNRGPL